MKKKTIESYLKIIQKLNKYAKTSQDNIWLQFERQISQTFKNGYLISFDSLFGQALSKYIQNKYQQFQGSQPYLQILQYFEKLLKATYSHKFISCRQYNQLYSRIEKQKSMEVYKWLGALTYLKNASSLQQFREDFMSRILDEDKEIQMFSKLMQQDRKEADRIMKIKYQNFFKQAIRNVSNIKILIYIQQIWSRFENKQTMIQLSTLKQLQKKLGNTTGQDKKQMQINKLIIQIAQTNNYENDYQYDQRLKSQLKILKKQLQKFCGLSVFKQKNITLRVAEFGSLVSGFASIGSDLDLTILTDCYINQIQLLALLKQFLDREKYDTASNRRKINFIRKAKTPLIAIQIFQRGNKTIKIDLIVNNILGVINSKFLAVFAKIKWIKNLGILLKLWGKISGIIDKDLMSSYSIILMMIHFLIQKKYIKSTMDARNRQNAPYFQYKRLKQGQIEQFRVYYNFSLNPQTITNITRINYRLVLCQFFKYYVQEILRKPIKQRIISVDMSDVVKSIDLQTILTIKDPFDEPHNPGRARISSQQFFKTKFQEAYQILQKIDQKRSIQSIKRLFDNNSM